MASWLLCWWTGKPACQALGCALVKAQVDAKGEVACEDCKKHIVAVISANLHIDHLKHALEIQEEEQERTDASLKAAGERYEDMA